MDIKAVLAKARAKEAFFALLKCVLDEPYKQFKSHAPELVGIITKDASSEWCFHTLYSARKVAGRDPETLQMGEPFLSVADTERLLRRVMQGEPEWIHETIRQVFLTAKQKNLLLAALVGYASGKPRDRYWIRETITWGRLDDSQKKLLTHALKKKPRTAP